MLILWGGKRLLNTVLVEVISSKYHAMCYIKTRPNVTVKFLLYLKKAGLASRNIEHGFEKTILCCVVSAFIFFTFSG